jgi:hypothetical protein
MNRDADESGMKAYADLLRSGADPEELVRRMVSSEEFRMHGGGPALLSRLCVPPAASGQTQ